jgi:hypothetical protein
VNRECDTILDADLPQQLGYVGFHCALPNAKGRPDFLVGAARALLRRCDSSLKATRPDLPIIVMGSGDEGTILTAIVAGA